MPKCVYLTKEHTCLQEQTQQGLEALARVCADVWGQKGESSVTRTEASALSVFRTDKYHMARDNIG